MARGGIAGFYKALFFFRDSSGYATGIQSTLANGSTSSAYVADFPRAAGITPTNPTTLEFQGGDRVWRRVIFGNKLTPSFVLTLGDVDTSLVTLVTGSSTNTANSYRTLFSDNPNRSAPRVMGCALMSRFANSDGSDTWITQWFPTCQVIWQVAGRNYQGATDINVTVQPVMTSKAVTGQVFGSSGLNMGLEGDQTDNYFELSAYPLQLVCFRADGAATTVTSTYRPISTVVTVNASPNPMYKNGTATALSSVVTTTGVHTLAAAGTAADMHVIVGETEYVPV